VPTITFGGLTIAYDADVLEPRPWTLAQSAWAVDLLTGLPEGPVLELCSGVGHIGLVVTARTGRRLVQVDDHPGACALARKNAADAGIAADVRCASIEEGVGRERFVLVVADPPYVPSGDTDRFAQDPGHAIDGGADGLALARRCVEVARDVLLDGCPLLMQTGGPDQAAALAEEAAPASYEIRSVGADRALLLLTLG
jgi:methylase of polypeptide subunit release factors